MSRFLKSHESAAHEVDEQADVPLGAPTEKSTDHGRHRSYD